jgi:Type II secretion system (T2SS), protein E, N-terminal domain
MGTMQDIADKVRGNLIPHLFVLRRVPMRYYRILPLRVMKKFQCIVVGSAPGVLTVAITNRQNTVVIESLKKFTGQSIFPVLIDPAKMRLLIQRIERNEYRRNAFHSRRKNNTRKIEYYRYAMYSLQVCSIVILLSSQKTRRV